jgi:glucose/arabinose dehydrogenase
LLGLAFHPQFIENGYFFVNYTDLQGDSVVSRFQVDPGSPDRADASREYQVLQVAQPYANHNGGGLAFGPDGYLYLGFGDGGSAGDPQGNGQNLDTLLGKLLRLDIDGEAPYAIPQDNPFKNGGEKGEIWAYGLRNPWRFSFDMQKGDLYIADVGQNMWEEINYLPAGHPAGANFGWNLLEGTHPYKSQNEVSSPPIPPIFEYNHEKGCSVTGGVVYRGKNLSEFAGIYLYGDYCSGLVWGLMQSAQGTWQNVQLFESMGQITSFGEDEQQEIYLVIHSGMILRLERK